MQCRECGAGCARCPRGGSGHMGRAEPEQVPERTGVGTRSTDRSVKGQSSTSTLMTSNLLCVSEIGSLHVRFPMRIIVQIIGGGHSCGFVDSSSIHDASRLTIATGQSSKIMSSEEQNWQILRKCHRHRPIRAVEQRRKPSPQYVDMLEHIWQLSKTKSRLLQ